MNKNHVNFEKFKVNYFERKLLECIRKISGIPGISNIASNRHIVIKIAWLLCLLTSIGYCFHVLTLTVINYYEYRVLIGLGIGHESSQDFPTITICNLNEFDLDNVAIQNALDHIESFNASIDIPTQEFELIKAQFLNQTSNESRQNMRLNPEKMILSCSFNGVPCEPSDFQPIQIELYGTCLQFNPLILKKKNKIKRSFKYGSKYGLEIELFLGRYMLGMTNGAILFLNNQTDLIKESQPGILLSPGTHTNLAINRHFYDKLPAPFSDCIKSNDIGDIKMSNRSFSQFVVKELGTYSQSHCLEMCQRGVNDMAILREQSEENNRVCSDYLDCILGGGGGRRKRGEGRSREDCERMCPRECDSVEYEKSISMATFPSKFYKEILLQNAKVKVLLKTENANKIDLKDIILSINVFYESDTYNIVTEIPEIDLPTLLAKLGGQFGLFLGIAGFFLLCLINKTKILNNRKTSFNRCVLLKSKN